VEPRWRSDGLEDVETPVRLFATDLFGSFANNVRIQYAVSRDGQRFLMNTPPHADYPSTMTVVVNWAGTLDK